ncbi:MAG: excinuclease ABC subunit UvrC [Deltaproteobacteria bacterium]|nr:excinuclease ABC subunit UvrC [Deltaproteobacteria bacterium]
MLDSDRDRTKTSGAAAPLADLGAFPASCGVYLMKDGQGAVLYVGKAKNLRARLRSYQGGADSRFQVRFLLDKVRRIDTIVTDTEKEALLLENTLIKSHRPRFNIRLRDDKTYVSLRLDPREEFPFFQIVRRVKKDGARYFGPFHSSSEVRQTLKRIYRLFPLRHYPMKRCGRRSRPCLYYQLGQCSAPCHGKIGAEDYRRLVDGAIAFLSGKIHEATALLADQMKKAAAEMRFEEAAALRDQIQALRSMTERQKVAGAPGRDLDVIGLHLEGGEVTIAVLFIRGGQLVSRRDFTLEWRLDREELLGAFLQQYYDGGALIPDQVLLSFVPEGNEALADWLSERKGRRVAVRTPKRGELLELVRLAERNAAEAFRKRGSRREAREQVLAEIRDFFGLRRLPLRMECFDISNLQGEGAVGSMAVFVCGEADKGEYRQFRIRTVTGADDYASLAEVLKRRLTRGKREESLPDFILIDGGKGQLSAVGKVLEELELEERVEVAGIAKDRVLSDPLAATVERTGERFFRPGRPQAMVLPEGSAALFLLEKLRNEAHRFAVLRHRRIRGRSALHSVLEEVPGIGPQRRRALLRRFGSVAGMLGASREELLSSRILPASVVEALIHALQERRK